MTTLDRKDYFSDPEKEHLWKERFEYAKRKEERNVEEQEDGSDDRDMLWGLRYVRDTKSRRRYVKEVERLVNDGLYRRLSSVNYGHAQFSWAQRALATEMQRLYKTCRTVPPQGRKVVTPEYVRIYYDPMTKSLHQRYGSDAKWNRLFSWVY